MKIEITCFKETGKYYSSHQVDIPEDVVQMIPTGGERLIYLPDLLDYIKSNKETWPTTTLNGYRVLVFKPDESDGIVCVPHLL